MSKKKILFIKSCNVSNVRLQKMLLFFQTHGYNISFWGWKREDVSKDDSMKGISIRYLLRNGGRGNRLILFFFYNVWIIKLFFRLVFTKDLSKYIIFVINFESAFSVWLLSLFNNRVKYIYEIRDEFVLSYTFPKFLKAIFSSLDDSIRKKASIVVQVDENRVPQDISYRYCIIQNSPYDYFSFKERDYSMVQKKFAVIGYFAETRGISQIYLFAKEHPSFSFLVVGRFMNVNIKQRYLALPNIEYYDLMPQHELFNHLAKCCAIFSLYDPILEINRLAASNKVYDAMMMGIPVITNADIINSKFVSEKEIGFIIKYRYDLSWQVFDNDDFLDTCIRMGKKGRQLYLAQFRFEKLLETRLLPVIEKM